MEISINDTVQVQLTLKGIEQYDRYYAQLSAKQGVPLRLMKKTLVTQHGGWSTFPLWFLFQIFGPQMYQGSNEQMFIGGKIRIVPTV